MTTTNRRPGKFEGCTEQDLGEQLHEMCGDMSFLAEDLGDVQDFGWYGLMINPLHDGRCFIVSEDSQGFFDYMEYATEADARKDWDTVRAEYDDFMGNEIED